eukprot:m.29275 g.29275  ORF g.29275 m.29275 type:complete len:664 (-) comp9092_c0_seq1:52-2043(-)
MGKRRLRSDAARGAAVDSGNSDGDEFLEEKSQQTTATKRARLQQHTSGPPRVMASKPPPYASDDDDDGNADPKARRRSGMAKSNVVCKSLNRNMRDTDSRVLDLDDVLTALEDGDCFDAAAALRARQSEHGDGLGLGLYEPTFVLPLNEWAVVVFVVTTPYAHRTHLCTYKRMMFPMLSEAAWPSNVAVIMKHATDVCGAVGEHPAINTEPWRYLGRCKPVCGTGKRVLLQMTVPSSVPATLSFAVRRCHASRYGFPLCSTQDTGVDRATERDALAGGGSSGGGGGGDGNDIPSATPVATPASAPATTPASAAAAASAPATTPGATGATGVAATHSPSPGELGAFVLPEASNEHPRRVADELQYMFVTEERMSTSFSLKAAAWQRLGAACAFKPDQVPGELDVSIQATVAEPDVEALGGAVMASSQLNSFCLHGYTFRVFCPPLVAAMAARLTTHHPSLSRLSLRSLQLTDTSWELLLKAVAASANVKHFYLNGTNLADTHLAHLLEPYPPLHLTSLSITEADRLSAVGCGVLARLLAHPECALESLCLSKLKIGAQGFAALVPGLKETKHLRDLELYLVKVGSKGGAAIAEVIEVCTTLRRLDLSSTGIGEKGWARLGDALAKPTCNVVDVKLRSSDWNGYGCQQALESAQAARDGLNIVIN